MPAQNTRVSELKGLDKLLKLEIIQNRRYDLLATEVLGYDCADFHAQILEKEKAHNRIHIEGPRGFGKTHAGTFTYLTGEILRNPNIRILLVSNTGPQAVGFKGTIEEQCTDNAKLRRIFGDFSPQKGWEPYEFTTRARTRKRHEATITAVGVFGQIITRHYDIIILEDVVDPDNVTNEKQREKVLMILYTVIYPCLEPWGQLIVIGTRYHFQDIYGHISALAGKLSYYQGMQNGLPVYAIKKVTDPTASRFRPGMAIIEQAEHAMPYAPAGIDIREKSIRSLYGDEEGRAEEDEKEDLGWIDDDDLED